MPANFIAEVKKSMGFGDRLKYAMVLLGQRPAAREPRPATTAWLRHLAAINEARPDSTPDRGRQGVALAAVSPSKGRPGRCSCRWPTRSR